MAYISTKVKERQVTKPSSKTQPLGVVSEVPMNEWNSAVSYEKLNLVTYKGGTFIAKRPSTGVAPFDSPNWEEVWMPLLSGIGISSAKVEYATSSTTSSEPPTDGWGPDFPAVKSGEYLWVRVTITYTDGKQSVFYSFGAGGVPTRTSQLVNDGNGTSPFATESFTNSSINALAAFFITPTATGGKAWASRAALLAAKTFYSGGTPRIPTQNDYAIVLSDESQAKGADGSYPTTRYSYQGGTYPDGQWDFQYIVNDTSLTQAQVDALNSGINSFLVEQITTNKKNIEENTEAIEGLREDMTALPASQVILQEDIILAGNYSEVGNISKSSDGTTYPAKGKSVQELIQEIFTKRLQPSITPPSASGLTFAQAGRSVEVGTHFDSITVSGLTLNKGRYTYDTDTGVNATGYKIIRVLDGTETEVASAQSVTDNNGGKGFTIGDNTRLQYKGTITYSDGNIANDNLGSPSDPPVRITAGTATTSLTGALTGYRAFFYGSTSKASPEQGASITSAVVRGLINSQRAYSSGTITLSVPIGATAVYIACVSTRTGVTKVMNTSNQTDITGVFTKQSNVKVEGAGGFTSADYNVWYYVPAVPFEATASLQVTLG